MGSEKRGKSYEAASLQSVVTRLHSLLHDVESVEELEKARDEIRALVHEVNAAYLDWAFEVDNSNLKVLS